MKKVIVTVSFISEAFGSVNLGVRAFPDGFADHLVEIGNAEYETKVKPGATEEKKPRGVVSQPALTSKSRTAIKSKGRRSKR